MTVAIIVVFTAKTMAKCPVCGKTFASKKDLSAHVRAKHQEKVKHYYPVPVASTSKQAGAQKVAGSGAGGWMAMEEYLGKAAKNKTSRYLICPGKSGMPRLDAYALLYEQYRIERWNVRFTPRVGTTVSGMYVAGIVYSHADNPDGVGEVAALQPKIHHAVWQGGNLSAAPGRLMKQKWMYTWDGKVAVEDSVAGKVAVHLDGDQAEVDVWVDYAVTFNGPTQSAKNTAYVLKHDGSSWKLDEQVITKLPDELRDGYTIDIESNSDISSYFEKFFGVFKSLYSWTQSGLYYYHLIADSFAPGYVLPVLRVPIIMYAHRQPFPQRLRAVQSELRGGVKESSSSDREAAKGEQGSEEDDSRSGGQNPEIGVEVVRHDSPLSGSFERLSEGC